MNLEPVEVIHFKKIIDSHIVSTCCLERCEDGSVGVFGKELGTLIFEFTADAFERAIAYVEKEGYVRVQ